MSVNGNDFASIVVGMADLKVTKSPGVLTTIGLGSCIGVALYDPVAKIAGLAHIMLPQATTPHVSNPGKFADTAIEKLVYDMGLLGAKPGNIVAKIAGGAQMFNFDSTNEVLRVGDRNVTAVKEELQKQCIPLIAEETGDTFGRTMEFYSESGKIIIKSIGQSNRLL